VIGRNFRVIRGKSLSTFVSRPDCSRRRSEQREIGTTIAKSRHSMDPPELNSVADCVLLEASLQITCAGVPPFGRSVF
jgi:hypothetical protein